MFTPPQIDTLEPRRLLAQIPAFPGAEGFGMLASGGRGGSANNSFRCGATASFTAAKTPYPDDTHDAISSDPNGTVRAWMAVTSYLLADGRFFLQ